MCHDGLADLDALHSLDAAVADYLASKECLAVHEADKAARIYLRDGIALVLCEVARGVAQRVANAESLYAPCYIAGGILLLNFYSSIRLVFRREIETIEIHVTARAFEVLYLKAGYGYAFHKSLLVSVQCVESIYSVVLGLVRGRIVKCEQRFELG